MVSVHGACATPSATRSARIASGERPRAQLPADPIPQRPRHRQAPRATSSPLPVGAPLRRRRAITPTAATSGNLTGDRRTDGGPRGDRSPPNPSSDPQLERRRSPRAHTTPAVRPACWYLHRSVLVLAPVIMTGTVHRPMELADPGRTSPSLRARPAAPCAARTCPEGPERLQRSATGAARGGEYRLRWELPSSRPMLLKSTDQPSSLPGSTGGAANPSSRAPVHSPQASMAMGPSSTGVVCEMTIQYLVSGSTRTPSGWANSRNVNCSRKMPVFRIGIAAESGWAARLAGVVGMHRPRPGRGEFELAKSRGVPPSAGSRWCPIRS